MKMVVKMAMADQSNKQQPSSVRESAEEDPVREASGAIKNSS